MKKNYQEISQSIDEMFILLKDKDSSLNYLDICSLEKRWNKIKMNEWRVWVYWSKRREMEKELDIFIKKIQRVYVYTMNTGDLLPWMKTWRKKTNAYLKAFFDNVDKLDSKVTRLIWNKAGDIIAFHSWLYLKWKIMKKRESEKSIIKAKAKEARAMKKMLEGILGYCNTVE